MRKDPSEKPATERQRSILDVIRAFTAEHGYPPSVREIGERVGLSSSSTIHAHLKALERRGLISRDPTKPRAHALERSLRLAADPTPSCCRSSAGSRPACRSRRTRTSRASSCSRPASCPRASDAFMLRVQGDSMVDAAILDGDLIVVRPQRIGRERRDRRRDARRRGDRQALLPRSRPHPLAAGESYHGANLRERCRDRRPRRGRRPPPLSSFLAGSSGAPCPVMRRLGELAVRRGAARGAALEFRRPRRRVRRDPVRSRSRSGTGQARRSACASPARLLPAFGVMAATLAVMLPMRLARATGYALRPAARRQRRRVCARAAAAVRPDVDRVSARRSAPSGLFIAMLACGLAAACDRGCCAGALRRRRRLARCGARRRDRSLRSCAAHVSLPAVIAARDAADRASRRHVSSRSSSSS